MAGFPNFASRGPGPRRDILEEERRRPAVFRWYGNFLTGHVGMAVLALFLAAGISVMAYRFITGDVRGTPAELTLAPHPDVGQPLTASQRTLAETFGRPIEVGYSGRPLIEHTATGEVREVTPVEEDYFEQTRFEPAPFVSTGYRDVVWNPGPSGWGMWWRDDSLARELHPDLAFPRFGWRDRQEYELRTLLRLLSAALTHVQSIDVEHWATGQAEPLLVMGEAAFSLHPLAERHSAWASVPGQWMCDPALEAALTQGVSFGCPSSAYHAQLADTWAQAGQVASALRGMGRVGSVIDGLSARDRHVSTAVPEFIYMGTDLAESVKSLERSLAGLRAVSADEQLPVTLYLFEVQ